MPELPEVETVKNGLEPVLKGHILTSVTLNRENLRFPFPDAMVKRIEGRECLRLRRRGKYIFIDLESGETLVIHLGMSGSFSINQIENKKHDHVVFKTDHGYIITYNDPRRFGFMFFVKTGEEHKDKAFATMGVEPLGNEFNGAQLHKKLHAKKTSIKSALLDQSVVAGVGNIYACEALYMAGICPLKNSNDLTMDEAENLARAIRHVLTLAIESGGSSLRDHKKTDGTMGYFQHSFKVYNRENMVCEKSGGIIKRIVQSGRSTFYCPSSQK